MLKIMIDSKTGKLRKLPLVIIIVLVVFVYTIASFLNVVNSADLISFTEDSIKKQLISVALAALEMLDTESFAAYESAEDIRADRVHYRQELTSYRALVRSVGAERIYLLKISGSEHMLVLDTSLNVENDELYFLYELLPVHIKAVQGERSADVLTSNEDGVAYDTGAVPVFYDGSVVGILCVEMKDDILVKSRDTSQRNTIILASSLLVVLGILLIFLIYLLKKVVQMQEALLNVAHTDTITGLPNRLYLLEYLEDHIKTKPEIPLAIFFIDLDNFKRVNDFAGHDAGDELLRKIGEFLKSSSKQAKTFHPSAGYVNVSARVGGDEFIQIYPGISTEEEARTVADKLFSSFTSTNINRNIERYQVSLSVGAAIYPLHSENFHVLIKYADTAMYEAKKAGKNRYRIYTDDMSSNEDKQ